MPTKVTSIRTDEGFWKEVRKFAVDVGTSVSDLIERAVRKEMASANGEGATYEAAPETVAGEHVPIWGNLCNRCGYPWKPEMQAPKLCPKCRSPFWHKARKFTGEKIRRSAWRGTVPQEQVKIPQSEVAVVPEKKEEPKKGLDWEAFHKVVREL